MDPRVSLLVVLSVLLQTAGLARAQSAASQPQSQTSADAIAQSRTPLAEIRGVATQSAPAPQAVEGENESELRALIENARTAIEDEKYSEAAQKLLDVIRREKHEHGEARRLLAIALEKLQSYDAAERYAAAAAAIMPDSADAQWLAGSLLLRLGRAADAIPHLRSATLAAEADVNNPNITHAWYLLGEALRACGYTLAASEAYAKFDEALFESHPEQANADPIREILKDSPRGALFRRVELLKQLSRDDEMVALTGRALARWPDDPAVAQAHAGALLDAGRAADALAFAKQRLGDRGTRGMFLPIAVEAAQRDGTLDAWIGEIETAARGGATPEFAAELVHLLNRTGRGAAAARLAQVLVAGGGPGDLGWDIAIGQAQAGNLAAGLETVAGIARELPPGRGLPEARVREWCAAVSKAGDFARQVPELRKREPRDFASDFALGLTAAGVGEPALAESLLAASLAAKGDFAPALTLRGRMLLANYDWGAAKAEARSILKAQPDLAAGWLLLADAQDGLDENDDAVESYKKAVRFGPTDPAGRLALAQHYRRLDDQLSAQRYYAEAIDLDPLCGEAHEGLIESYIRDGKIELVKEHWREMQTLALTDDVMRRVGTTVRYFQRNRLFSADHVAEMARQFAEHPGDTTLARYYAAALIVQRKPAEAEKACDAALARAPDDFQLLLVKAELAMNDARFDAAVSIFETLRKHYPNREVVLRRLALADRYDFRTAEARELLTRLADRPSETKLNSDRLMLYQSYAEFGEFEAADKVLDVLIAAAPDNMVSIYRAQKLSNLVTAGKGDEALGLATKRLDAAPGDDDARDLYYTTALELKRYAEVEAKVREWMKGDPEGQYAGNLVDVLVREKKFDEAMEAAKKAPDTNFMLGIRRRVLMGQVERAAGKPALAVAEFDAIAEGQSTPAEMQLGIRREIIAALCDDQQFDPALARCDKWIKADGDAPQTKSYYLRLKSFTYQMAGRQDEYLDNLEAQWLLEPEDKTLNNDLGYAWVDAGRNLDRATAMIRKAVALDPMQHAYLDSLGWACYKAGDFAGAKKYIGRAAQLYSGRDPDVFDHLGDAEWRLGEKDAAAGRWREACKLLEAAAAQDGARPAPDQVKLLASVRAKIAAVDGGLPPPTAPLIEKKAEAEK